MFLPLGGFPYIIGLGSLAAWHRCYSDLLFFSIYKFINFLCFIPRAIVCFILVFIFIFIIIYPARDVCCTLCIFIASFQMYDFLNMAWDSLNIALNPCLLEVFP